MKETATLITAIAAIVGALIWPASIIFIATLFRCEIRSILEKIPSIIDRAETVNLGGFIEAKLNQLAENSDLKSEQSGEVTSDEVRVAATLQAQVNANVIAQEDIYTQMDRLSIQYDTIRRAMRGSSERTREMTKILAQMRALAPSVSDMIEAYKSSGAAGSRLAAIAMMQMEPQMADIDWLTERFKVENPFVFYHSALAIQNVVDTSTGVRRMQAIEAAKSGLNTLRSFAGQPDQQTINVLTALTNSGEHS